MKPLHGRSGFTLLEMILATGLAFMLMAALYQTISMHGLFITSAEIETRQAQIARTLLHRIADELTQLSPPTSDGIWPEHAQRLLAFGDYDDERARAGLGPSSNRTSELSLTFPESFRILGRQHCLLLMTQSNPINSSVLTVYHSDTDASSNATSNQTKGATPAVNKGLRQVYYLMKPHQPDDTSESEMTAPNLEFNLDGVFEPLFGGLIRQEVSAPGSIDAQLEAAAQLEEQVGQSGATTAQVTDAGELPIELPGLTPPRHPAVRTEQLSEEITAIVFRYQDGNAWLSVWDDPTALPIAVEIAVSFDPRAADPERLQVYFDSLNEERSTLSATASDEETDESLFPYRLVVAIPTRGFQSSAIDSLEFDPMSRAEFLEPAP